MTVTGNRDATVGHIRIAFLNHIGRYVGVARAGYAVALARDVAAIKTHRRRTSFNLAVVVGVIADAYQVHHGRVVVSFTHVDCFVARKSITGKIKAELSVLDHPVLEDRTDDT